MGIEEQSVHIFGCSLPIPHMRQQSESWRYRRDFFLKELVTI